MKMGFLLGEAARSNLPKQHCWKKQKWGSEGAAKAHLRSLLKRTFVKDVDRLNVYKCRDCGSFHVGRVKVR